MQTELLTSEEMKIAEDAVIAEGVSETTLMEKAGEEVAYEILTNFSPCSVVVVCGPGKNGGDGKVAARLLQEAGWFVKALHFNNLPSHEDLRSLFGEIDLIVDGLFGTGLTRSLEGEFKTLVDLMNESGKPIVAIDIPSGIDSNSGTCFGASIKANMTVTFLRAKPGHILIPGRLHTGQLFVKDIGIPDQLLPPITHYLNTPSLWNHLITEPSPYGHKYSRGACLVVGDGCMPGAIRLATYAARRVGAGLVRLMCKSEEYPIYASSAWGEIVTPIATAKEYLEWATDKRFKALLWGPGAFPKESTLDQALLLLSTKKPCVLDGGALSSFEGNAQLLSTHLHPNVILTPHEGEFIRLFPHHAFLNNKADKARNAAIEIGAVVVLKGFDTIIASPSGKVIINANAPATLATAGTGDVLAGMMAGLLAQGLEPFYAAAAAVWMHGEAASRRGLGLIAEDIIDEIPAVLQYLSALDRSNDAVNNAEGRVGNREKIAHPTKVS
jgi:hydroxyethylthiazole kinase-like uncharacterized protein yjeF